MKKIIILLITLISLFTSIYASNSSTTPYRTITWNEFLNIQTKSTVIGQDDRGLIIIYNGETVTVLFNN
jgi:thioredoxin-related protein